MKADQIARDLKIDVPKAQEDYKKLIQQAAKRYMEETGINDEMRATIFAAKYFQPLVGTERQDPAKAYGRWLTAETAFNAALTQEKAKVALRPQTTPPTINQAPQQTLAGRPSNVNQVNQPTVVQPTVSPATTTAFSGQIENPKTSQFTTDTARSIMGKMAPDTAILNKNQINLAARTAPNLPLKEEAPIVIPEEKTATLAGQRAEEGESAGEFEQRMVQKFPEGIPASVQAEVNRRKNVKFGKNPPTGTRYQAMAGTLGEQGGWTPEMEKALMQTSTDYQLMTNKRLTDAQAQNARLRAMANRLKGAKMASDERLKIQSEKDKNDRNRASIQTQVAAINSRIAIANKDPFGQTNTDELKRASEELDNLQGVLSIMDDNRDRKSVV
jgi:hypothetical protein